MKIAALKPQQEAQDGSTTQALPKVSCQRANVCARSAGHPQSGRVPGLTEKLDLVVVSGSSRQLELLTAAGSIVAALAVLTQGRNLGGGPA